MSHKPAYVVSDIHLGAVPATTERAFREFLRHLEGRASELLINGDLFDFWFEYRTVIQAQHFRVLAVLADLVESGVRISFLGGNHDAWGGAFLREQVGIRLLEELSVIELEGRRALVAHGDGLGSGDLAYRALRRVLRNPLTTRAFRMLHPDWGSRIAALVTTTPTKTGNTFGADPSRAAEVMEWAGHQLRQRPELDLVIAGHTHTPAVEELLPGRFYVNTGDWLHHFTYLVLERGANPALRRWEGGGREA